MEMQMGYRKDTHQHGDTDLLPANPIRMKPKETKACQRQEIQDPPAQVNHING